MNELLPQEMSETFIERRYRPNRLCCAAGLRRTSHHHQFCQLSTIHLENGFESKGVCIIARSGKWISAVVIIMLFMRVFEASAATQRRDNENVKRGEASK